MLLGAGIIGLAKFTNQEGLFIKFFNGVTQKDFEEKVKNKVAELLASEDVTVTKKFNETVKKEILASLPSQDFVTPESLNSAIETKVSAFASSQDSIGIKSGKEEFKHFKGSNYDKVVLEKMKLMQKDASEFREIKVYYNEDKSSYFKKRPEIILGISSVNSEHTVKPANLAIEATVSEVYEDSFRLQVKTFHNSYFYKVEVNWLAYGIKK